MQDLVDDAVVPRRGGVVRVDCGGCEGGVAGVGGDLGQAGGGEGLRGFVSYLFGLGEVFVFVWWVRTNVEVVAMVAVRLCVWLFE